MFYNYFKKSFLSFKDMFYKLDKERLESQVFPTDVEIKTFSYSSEFHEMKQFNLYKHQNASINDPLIICIHGGAWVYGTKDLDSLFCCYLAQQGFNVVAPSYRLVDEVNLKGIQEDIFEFLRYVEKEKETLGITFDNVFLTGDSAGGQLALTTYIISSDKNLKDVLNIETQNFEFKAVCLNHSVCYLDRAGTIRKHPFLSKISIPGFKRIMFTKNYKKDIWYNSISKPPLYINKDRELVPLLIVTSENDEDYYYQSVLLKDYLESQNINFSYYLEKNIDADHVFNIKYPYDDLGSKCNDYIATFFKKYVKK